MRAEHEPVIVQYLNGSSQETLTLSGFVNLSLKTNIRKQQVSKTKGVILLVKMHGLGTVHLLGGRGG